MTETFQYLRDNISIGFNNELNIVELEDLLKSFGSFFNESEEQNELKEFFRTEYKTYSLTLDCLILWNICAAQIMIANSPELSAEKRDLTNKGYFTQLLFHLTNNLISIKCLFEKGLASQPKYIYRNSIELSDLAISVLYDSNFFENHKKPNLKKKGNPFISPKNATISKIAEDMIKKVNNELGESIDSSNILSVFWKRLRSEQYEILSESAHGNYLHNLVNVYKENSDGTYSPSLGGDEWKGLERQLSDMCLHQITTKRYFTWILKLKHDIDLFDNHNKLHRFIYFLDIVIGKNFIKEIIKTQIDDDEKNASC